MVCAGCESLREAERKGNSEEDRAISSPLAKESKSQTPGKVG